MARERAQQAADRYAAAETAAGVLEDDLERLRVELAAVEKRFDAAASVAGDVAVERYMTLGNELNFLRGADLYGQAREDALARLVTRQSQGRVDRLAAARQDLQIKRGELDSRLRDQRNVNDRLSRDYDDLQTELANLQELERVRRAEEQRAAAAAAAAGSGGGGGGGSSAGGGSSGGGGVQILASGSWVCPVQGSSAFSDTWGEPRSGGRRHLGVDMFADYGVPIAAVVGGTVEDNTGGAGGIAVYLYGNDGHTYYYAHLQSIEATGSVRAGQLIATVGDSGNASGTPHLHFEFHPGGGSASNAYPLVASHC